MKISFDLFKLGQIEHRCHQRPKTAPQQKNPEDEREMHSAAPLRRGIQRRQIAALPLEVPRAAPGFHAVRRRSTMIQQSL
jgi:hypothetical protein